MIKTTIIAVSFTTLGLFGVVNDFQAELPQPVAFQQQSTDPYAETRQALVILGRDPKYAKAVYITALAKDIDPILWSCNIECESDYKITARSPLGYKGLGQTPRAIMKLGYEEADLMVAACIFQEKRRIAKGNDRLAWALYKGGNNPAARREAQKVFTLYEKVKAKIKEQEDGNV